MGTRSHSLAPGLIDRRRQRVRGIAFGGLTFKASQITNLWIEERRHAARPQESPLRQKRSERGRRPDHREYPQHSSVFCPRAARALPPFRFYDRRSADWSPSCWGADRGINRSGAGACLRARKGMAQKASEARSGLRLSKSGPDGRQPLPWITSGSPVSRQEYAS